MKFTCIVGRGKWARKWEMGVLAERLTHDEALEMWERHLVSPRNWSLQPWLRIFLQVITWVIYIYFFSSRFVNHLTFLKWTSPHNQTELFLQPSLQPKQTLRLGICVSAGLPPADVITKKQTQTQSSNTWHMKHRQQWSTRSRNLYEWNVWPEDRTCFASDEVWAPWRH